MALKCEENIGFKNSKQEIAWKKIKKKHLSDASQQGGEEEGDGGDGEDEGAAVGGGGKY